MKRKESKKGERRREGTSGIKDGKHGMEMKTRNRK